MANYIADCVFVSPGSGWIGNLQEAPDPVFADKIMGDGVLLDPTTSELSSPCDGKVVSIARTKHAITIKSNNGAEILMHIGIDTVSLQGDGFNLHVKMGQKVKQGQILVSYDLNQLAHQAKSVLTPIILCNSSLFKFVNLKNGSVNKGDIIFELHSKEDKIDDSCLTNDKKISQSKDQIEEIIALPLEHGLHARPAARLATEMKAFQSQIQIIVGNKQADAKSTVGLMGLGTKLGDKLLIRVRGIDADKALETALEQIKTGLGEVPVKLLSKKPLLKATSGFLDLQTIKLDGSTVLKGTMGAAGLKIGKVWQWTKQAVEYKEKGLGKEFELTSLLAGVGFVREKLLRQSQIKEGVQEEILQAHISLLDDPGLLEEANLFIGKDKSASYAWHKAIGRNIEVLKSLDDQRMAQRCDDLLDIERQVIERLAGKENQQLEQINPETIIVASEILPSQFAQLSEKNIGGMCLVDGGATSHVSILASDRAIPTLVAMGKVVATIPNGTDVILDADKGLLYIAPCRDEIKKINDLIKSRLKNYKLAKKNTHLDCLTKDGVRIEVFANLGESGKASKAVEFGAEGCGLLRSEFLFLGRNRPPSEDEQLKIYQAIIDDLQGRPLVIRTMDIGGDKPVAFVEIPHEENPALGLRGIRVSLRREDLFLAQIKAILRVKTKSKIHIMLPMVIDIPEFIQAKDLMTKACVELENIKPLSLGIMIETPSSAVLAEQLACEVDFFSVGTNDLTQYVLAIDRGNADLAVKMDALHPAVIRMIYLAAKGAKKYNKWLGVCGGAASDLAAVPILIGLGVSELSATINKIPQLKAFIRTLDYKDCQDCAKLALEMQSAQEIREFIRQKWSHLTDWQ